jgi:hypothetical protein
MASDFRMSAPVCKGCLQSEKMDGYNSDQASARSARHQFASPTGVPANGPVTVSSVSKVPVFRAIQKVPVVYLQY